MIYIRLIMACFVSAVFAATILGEDKEKDSPSSYSVTLALSKNRVRVGDKVVLKELIPIEFDDRVSSLTRSVTIIGENEGEGFVNLDPKKFLEISPLSQSSPLKGLSGNIQFLSGDMYYPIATKTHRGISSEFTPTAPGIYMIRSEWRTHKEKKSHRVAGIPVILVVDN